MTDIYDVPATVCKVAERYLYEDERIALALACTYGSKHNTYHLLAETGEGDAFAIFGCYHYIEVTVNENGETTIEDHGIITANIMSKLIPAMEEHHKAAWEKLKAREDAFYESEGV